MICMTTTLDALRKCMTPTSWAKYCQENGIRQDQASDSDKIATDIGDLKAYEVTPELQQLMAEAEKLDAQFKALGFTLDPF